MIVRMKNVKKHYGGFEYNTSLEIREDYITGLIGINGAGKSTTFKLILNLIKKEQGTIEIFGESSNSINSSVNERIGVVLGNLGFCNEFNIKSLIPILSSMYKQFDREQFDQYCKRFSLPYDKTIKDFSTGMKKRLALIIALSHNASLLILDEPTSGLDVVAREEILDILRKYMETPGRSIIISTHISSDLEGFCDDIYVIHDGSIAFHENTDTITDEYACIKVSNKQFSTMEKKYITYTIKEDYGYLCLTNQKQFYLENYKDIIIEKCHLDDFTRMVEKGEKL